MRKRRVSRNKGENVGLVEGHMEPGVWRGTETGDIIDGDETVCAADGDVGSGEPGQGGA